MRQTSCARGGAGGARGGPGAPRAQRDRVPLLSPIFFSQKRLSRAFMSFNFSRALSLSLGAVYGVLPCLSIQYTLEGLYR
jgi:hypothetical protein